MREPSHVPRQRPPPLASETSARLLRAVEELRALEREKQAALSQSKPFNELSRRLEAKAREVFRLAQTAGTEGSDRQN